MRGSTAVAAAAAAAATALTAATTSADGATIHIYDVPLDLISCILKILDSKGSYNQLAIKCYAHSSTRTIN